jgi:hypothetical protein
MKEPTLKEKQVQWAISLANEAIKAGDNEGARGFILYWMELVGLITIKRKENNE